ncbi:MAG: hypothetical protein K9M11_03675 [Candidatus Pacebacteria bacterium]|nr:hypothetical protein [Candidatus Paceibacterota bacterium]
MKNSLEANEKFKLLPEDAKSAVRDFEYDKTLKVIHDTYKLHIDQAYTLEKAVADVIFGDIEPHDLVSFLKNELRLTPETALQLSTDINTKILLPIQAKMRAIQAE